MTRPNPPSFTWQVRELIAGHVIVGHSLENDFGALGFFPPRHMCRDTAHDVRRLLSRGGRPRKLRRIAWEHLGLIIQDSDDGHDPLEDARAALLLYQRFEADFEAMATRRAAEHEAKEARAARRAEERAAVAEGEALKAAAAAEGSTKKAQ